MNSSARKQPRYVYRFLLFALLSPLIVVGCSTGSGSGGGNAQVDNSAGPTPSANNPPVAAPGEDQVVTAGADVTLDGSQSSDSDGDAITFSWEQKLGTSVTLSSTSDAMVTFTAPANGTTLRFDLTVSDGQSNSVGTVDVSVHPADASAQVIEVRQRAITDDPAVNGDLESGWTVTPAPETPPPLDDDEFEPDDLGGPAVLHDMSFAPIVEEDLSPGASRQVELQLAGPSALMGSVRWIGTTTPLEVNLSLDGSSLATGGTYSFAADRGGYAAQTSTSAGGQATLSVTNTTGSAVTVRIVLGAHAL